MKPGPELPEIRMGVRERAVEVRSRTIKNGGYEDNGVKWNVGEVTCNDDGFNAEETGDYSYTFRNSSTIAGGNVFAAEFEVVNVPKTK